jgi:cell division GTPase FtsZ
VKPEGRALDIVVVGLGQAGGNLAAELHRRGYRALALNTAHTDLSALEPGGAFPTLPAERRLYVGLDGYDGAGADPGYGRECIHEHAERIRAAVAKQAQGADAVILAAGLGGGTGSSIAELARVLEEDQLPLVALLTLPSESESGIAKVNAVRAIDELLEAPLLGWIFADNERLAELHADVAVADYFAHVNSEIVAPLDAFNRLNDRDGLKAIRSFDGEDFRKLLLSGGLLNYGISELPAISLEEVVGTVRELVETSEIMPRGFELKKLSYLGLVLEAPESALAEVPISAFERIHETLKRETGGAGVYQGIYRTAPGQPITLRMIAGTQALPLRIRELVAEAKREGQALGEKVREELPSLELGEVAGFELFRTRSRPSERPRKANIGGGLGRRSALREELAPELGQRLEASAGRAEPDGVLDAGANEDVRQGLALGPRNRLRARSRRPGPAASSDDDGSASPASTAEDGDEASPHAGPLEPAGVKPSAGPPSAFAPRPTEDEALGPASPPSSSPGAPPSRPTPSGAPPAPASAPSVTGAVPASSRSAATPMSAPAAGSPQASGASGARAGGEHVGAAPRPAPAQPRSATMEPRAAPSSRGAEPPLDAPRIGAVSAGDTQAGILAPRLRPDEELALRAGLSLLAEAAPSGELASTARPAARAAGEPSTEELDLTARLSGVTPPAVRAEEQTVSAPFPGLPRPVLSEAEQAWREAHAQLIAQFLQASGATTRQQAAERLQADARATDARLRHSAVDAMARLGRRHFAAALLAATDDEDEAVRAVAIEALQG